MIATIGEALVDLIEQQDGRFQACLGGSVCNFTLGVARQGISTAYLNPLSKDKFGEKFSALLSGNGVVLKANGGSASPTALAVVSLDDQGSPTYAFHRQGVADRDISAERLIASLPESLELLHTGGLALVPGDLEKILTVIREVGRRKALVSIDANLRPIAVTACDAYVEGVQQAIAQAHILKVSDEDLAILGFGDATPAMLAAILFHESTLQLIAVTHGARGATLLTRACQMTLPAPNDLKVADTVGAGDCFHAGLISYLARTGKLATEASLRQVDQDFLRCTLQHAIAAASINIMRSGCDPATWEETRQFSQPSAQ
jgi:fructokinase